MPPPSSPTIRSPRRAASPIESAPPDPRPLTPLSYLSSPVPDLASTLHTVNDDVDEANVSFLRGSLESLDRAEVHRSSSSQNRQNQSHVDTRRDPRLNRTSERTGTQTPAETLDDSSRRERLQRVLARLNRIHDPAASSASAYSNRTPSPNRQSLYDWAPSHDETAREDESELDQILTELRRQQPDTHPDILRVLSQSQLDAARQRDRDSHVPSTTDLTDAAERRDRLRERRRRESEWVSLRSRAVLQRARQESSPSATERMLRYVMERERSGMSEEEERARGTGWFSPSANGSGSGSGNRSAEQHRASTPASRESWPLPPSANELRTRTMQERAEAMQRRYMTENAPPPRLPRISTPPVPTSSTPSNSSSQFLENALKYLNQLRNCYTYESALSAAIDHGLATKEFFADKHDDFVMDLTELNPVAGSSWLQPGTVFEGHQHATNGNTGLLQSRSSSASHSVEQINPNYRNQGGAATTGFDHPPGSTRVTPFDARRPWLSHQFVPPSSSSLSPKPPDFSHDRWPVRVIIHSIDEERMSLQGTMEAYDVPQHPAGVSILNSSSDRPKAGKKHAPITTYLEGHIIDLQTHSFLTPSATDNKRHGPHPTSSENTTPYTTISDTISFPSANAHTDASNWRKLPPFNSLSSEEETARMFLSQAQMNDIGKEYVFMRWKEKCFVHDPKDEPCQFARDGGNGDQDRGHGLTISGFYYISLRRLDGCVEGLYFDPTSTPYQCLRLRGRG
ncbi:hypothetical protein HII31_13434, partial [Pseudocercospora fuligena]